MTDNPETPNIEQNVPIPASLRPGPKQRYPFDKMRVGDSFEVPIAKLNSVRTLAYLTYKTGGRQFTVRKTNKGARCWRVK